MEKIFLRHLRALLLLLICVPQFVWALKLYTWNPSPNIPKLVLAVRDGETPKQAAMRYLDGIRHDPGLSPLLAETPLEPLTLKNFELLSDQDINTRTLLLANRPQDYSTEGNWRMDSFTIPLREDGVTPYMLPYSAEIGLNEAETKEFINLVDLRFPPWILMGGADLDGTPFGISNERSIDVNPRRDYSERLFVSQKVRTIKEIGGTHRLVAICRGGQLLSAILGLQINTHIPNHGGHSADKVEGGEGGEPSQKEKSGERLHEVRLLPTTTSWVANVFKQLTAKPRVNTYHHQEIIPVPGNKALEVAAVSPEDNVVEALESPDGRMVVFQFHPELMAVRSVGEARLVGRGFMRAIARLLSPQSCASALTH